MRLTEAQRRELQKMSTRLYASHIHDEYKPIKRLLELGFVERKDARFGGGVYRITPEGRAALAQSVEKK